MFTMQICYHLGRVVYFSIQIWIPDLLLQNGQWAPVPYIIIGQHPQWGIIR